MAPRLCGVESSSTHGGEVLLPAMLGWARGFIVSRMFELMKWTCLKQVWIFEFAWFLNLWWCFSGYKLHKHIATVLQAHSQPICSALEQYNAASATSPPHPNPSWDDVIKYMFLARFDLLCESQQDVCDQPWWKPVYRVMIDQYFKLEHAQEEIQHLNIKIPQVIIYIWDKDIFLQMKESEVREESPGLALQIEKHKLERGCSNKQHMHRFRQLASLPAFSSSIKPGVSVESCQGVGMLTGKSMHHLVMTSVWTVMVMGKVMTKMRKMIR